MSEVLEGSFIKVDYIARLKEGGNVFDTSIEEEAKKAGIFDENKVYEPLLLIVGSNWFPPVVEKELHGHKEGDEIKIEVRCEDAFGPRDPSNIKLVPRREFQKMQINPQKGQWLTVGNQEGKVLSVTAGRVRIDFNHKLAGEDLVYELFIRQVIEDKEGKIQAIIGRRLPGADLSDAKVEINGDNVIIELPKRVLYFEYIQFAKKKIAEEIVEKIDGFKRITFIEHFDF